MRANTQKQQGEQETRAEGEGRKNKKTVGNRDMRRYVEGREMGLGYTGETRWTLQGLSGSKAGNLKEVVWGGQYFNYLQSYTTLYDNI